MSEEMAVSDNTTGDEAKLSNDETATATVAEPEEVAAEEPNDLLPPAVEESPALEEAPAPEPDPEPEIDLDEPPPEYESETADDLPEVKEEPEEDLDVPLETTDELEIKKEDFSEIDTYEHNIEDNLNRGIKRRASEAFSDPGDEHFIGFDDIKIEIKTEDYSRILERLEAEVTAATRDLVPLRTVMATPPAPGKASKRPRKDTDGSRPSSALSSRSDGDGATDASATSSPAQRGGRRATTEMSSPLLRVPLERGWKRELVYRAALDAHSRRNADIYYYTPHGKKLRSTREVAEHLAGTGLTVENFSFFKEPLGMDDPEKEIIRDAKLIRRVESPVAAAAPAPQEGKRTPKPKPPKGASPEPAATGKSPPAKLKVKSMGSRLSNNVPPAAAPPPSPAPAPPKQQKKPAPQPAPPTTIENNNTAAWKKPSAINPPLRVLSGGECSALSARPPPPPQPAPRPPAAHAPPEPQPPAPPPPAPIPPPPPGRAEPPGRAPLQPCSMSCGRGAVPSLSCAACLCLYHPACAGYHHAAPPEPFLCKNCRKSSSPPLEPPTLTHKSGVATGSLPVPAPVPVPRRVPVPAKVPRDKRVMLRMKVAGGTPDGERVWAVAGGPGGPGGPCGPGGPGGPCGPGVPNRAAQPQGLAVLNGRRFVVVPRNLVTPAQHPAAH